MSLEVQIRKQLASFPLDVAFTVEDSHEILALLGASGCGKSMTLRCIAGLEKPDSGRIVLNGRVLFDSDAGIDLSPQERHVGYLFQSYALFPTMSVIANVKAGIASGTRREKEEKARKLLCGLHLEGTEGLKPAQLSGGQQQRVAIARILASDPELLLLDEPFSALDGYLRWQLEMELSDLLHSFPGGTIFVSHNRDEVYRLCDTVSVIARGRSDPKISIKELFAAPQSLAAALISGCKNISKAELVRREDGRALVSCTDWGLSLWTTLPVPEHLTHVGIRAHYFEIAGTDRVAQMSGKEENCFSCPVARVIDSTFSTIVMLETPAGVPLRYELGKDAWAQLGNPAAMAVAISPDLVMPLEDTTA